MHKRIALLASVLTFSVCLVACHSDDDKVKEAENDVFAIHDEVMPKIDDIMKLRKQLKVRITSLEALKANGSASATLRTDEEKEQASRLHRDLDVADSLMMDWMGKYNGDTLTKLSSDEALRYLDGQRNQIIDVKTKVNTSIEQARQFLGKK